MKASSSSVKQAESLTDGNTVWVLQSADMEKLIMEVTQQDDR